MKKVMVFDEPEIVSFIQGTVGDQCELVWTHRDNEVADCFQQEKPDIVLMNYEVSDCERFGKLIHAIREQNPDVPIVLLTGPDIVLHFPVNVSGSLVKPFQKEWLERTLQRYKIIKKDRLPRRPR